ncbi:Oidioi.mRNA.OKI2018_I69.chr2.g4096.t1.cds [Oikopleura dioica]|uniref:Oidioi.mRNA.OKI2018_I69.chr2.g4096.t1.cds n=1 Tax=Oikopleura dioica TaxID=34765 RepID=A0ABN7T0H8_OIKDI|nr:Oidioi.mRNA.OKI2018_I69.chr2.g4096.t1.cds [Oikopleura dioica]
MRVIAFSLLFAAYARVIREIEGSGEEQEARVSYHSKIHIKTPEQINAAFMQSLERTRINHERLMAKTRTDYEKFQEKMKNLRSNESVKAIEEGIKADLKTGLRTAQEKMQIESEGLEPSNPFEPIARTGIDLFSGLIDDVIVSINRDD